MANRYFSDDWHTVRASQNEYERSKHAEITKIGQCQVCLEETTLYSSGFCGHFYCKPCWTSYIKQ